MSDLYYHAASGRHVRAGQAFTLPLDVTMDHPEVREPDPEHPGQEIVHQAHTTVETQEQQYPANWLQLASAEDKAAAGLQEVLTVGQRADDRYYWVQEQLVGAQLQISNTPKALDQVGELVWQRIKAARDLAEYGGFSWDGSTFDSDPMSQSRIQGAVLLASMSPTFSVAWTLKDNTVRTLGAADLAQVGAALGQHVQLCHETARQIRQQIGAAQSIEALLALAWPG